MQNFRWNIQGFSNPKFPLGFLKALKVLDNYQKTIDALEVFGARGRTEKI